MTPDQKTGRWSAYENRQVTFIVKASDERLVRSTGDMIDWLSHKTGRTRVQCRRKINDALRVGR